MERPSWWIDYFISTLLLTLQQGGHSYPRVLRQKKKKKREKEGHTPIGPHVLKNTLLDPLNNRPEYFTTEWIVSAGSPIDASDWNTARSAITVR